MPDYAAGSFLVRAATLSYMDELVEKVRAIAEGAALITGARLEWVYPSPANADMVTNYTLARVLDKHARAVGLAMPEAKAEQASGSTDWGNVSYVVPSVETSYPIIDRICTWHSMDVVNAADSEMGYENTIRVAKAMALAGLDILRDQDHCGRRSGPSSSRSSRSRPARWSARSPDAAIAKDDRGIRNADSSTRIVSTDPAQTVATVAVRVSPLVVGPIRICWSELLLGPSRRGRSRQAQT